MKLFQNITWLEWLLLGVILLIVSGFVGLSSGYLLSVIEREKNLSDSIAVDTQVQFNLGKQDFEAGNYDLARQRFEYVLQQDPAFPGAVDMLSETLVLLSIPAVQITDIPNPSSASASTPDTRPVEE